MVIILGWSLGILADKVAKVMSWSEMPRGHVPFCLTRSFLFVTMRSINVLEWLVILVGPFTTFFILNCSSIPFILFPSYDVSPRSSCKRLVFKSSRSTIFENFVQIFSINFGNAVKNSLFWFGGRYIVPTRMSLESAFHWKKTQKSNVVFTWFWHGFCKIQPPIITMFGFNLVFLWGNKNHCFFPILDIKRNSFTLGIEKSNPIQSGYLIFLCWISTKSKLGLGQNQSET